jgi:molybdopterin-guanine dinucleotide biosynthesis protein A
MAQQHNKVSGVVLAGGRARRMAYADKGLVLYKGLPLVSYALQALALVVEDIVINANRNIETYSAMGFAVVSDSDAEFSGPLAGVLAAMRYCKAQVLLVLPCDSPLVTAQHLHTLLNSLGQSEVAIAYDGQRLQPVFMAITTQLEQPLADYLAGGGRKLADFLMQRDYVLVDFSDSPELFINLNTPNELAELQARDA